MEKIKFVIFGSRRGTNWKDLEAEIKARGFECVFLDFGNTTFDFSDKGMIVKNSGVDLGAADIFLFQGFAGYVREAKVFMDRMVAEGKTVVDEGICRRVAEGKLLQASKLSRRGLNIPRTYQASTSRGWKEILSGVDFPIVVKPVKGSRGRGVMKFDTKREASVFFQAHPTDYLAQEFFRLDSDLRIFVVKDKILGGIRRHVVPGDFRTNCSLGSRAEKIAITPAIRETALRAASAVGYEVAGVDLVECEGELFVLEVNAAPQWKGFKAATGINPAAAVIDLALEKFRKRVIPE